MLEAGVERVHFVCTALRCDSIFNFFRVRIFLQKCLVLNFSVFSGLFKLVFIAESHYLHPKNEVYLKNCGQKIIYDHKLTTFAYFTGKMHFLPLLWVFLTAKKHLCMIACE
jgi:hypothetical protein